MGAPDAGLLDAAPRGLPGTVRVRGVVRPDRAGLEPRRDLPGALRVARPDARPEAEWRIVRQPHGFVLRVERLHRHDGAEDLLALDPRVPRAAREHRRLVEPAGQRHIWAPRARERLRPVLARIGDELLDALALLGRDQRADLSERILAGAQTQAARPRGERVHEYLVPTPGHVDALHARADLAAVEERAPQRACDGPLEVAVVEHQHRILAAELERHRTEPLGARRADETTDLGRAGEEHLRDAAGADESVADGLADPLRHAHEAGRRARLAEHALDPLAREGRQLGGLDDDRVPGRDRRCRLRERDREGEVPGRHDGHNAVRLVDEPAALVP